LTLALGLAVAAPAILPMPVAHATQFADLSVEQFTDASSWIVQGEVTEVWTELDDRGRVWTRARLNVADCLKGTSVPDELIIDSMGGTHGAIAFHIPAAAAFSVGEELLAFLYETPDGRNVPVSKFLGKYSIRRAPGETRRHAMTWHPKNGRVFDARFLPHPAPERRVYLDDLVDRVQQRLDKGWDGKPITGISAVELKKINTLDRRMPR
jgi:hypothetical protein